MKTFTLTSLLILTASAHTHAHTDLKFEAAYVSVHRDSGVPNPEMTSVEAEMKRLEDTYPGQAQVVTYGRSLGGKNLKLIRIGARSNSSREKRLAIQISGAIHGNEYLGIEDQLARYFLVHQKELPGLSFFLAKGGVIYLVPVVNPDGLSKRRRYNDAREDLNRDFDMIPTGERRFTQPEVKALSSYLDQDLRENQLSLKFSMDYHCCLGAMITPWAYQNAYPKQEDLLSFNQIAQLEKSTLGFPVGNTTDTVGYLASGSSVDYFYARYGTLAFALEGQYGGEKKRFEKHIQFFDQILGSL